MPRKYVQTSKIKSLTSLFLCVNTGQYISHIILLIKSLTYYRATEHITHISDTIITPKA